MLKSTKWMIVMFVAGLTVSANARMWSGGGCSDYGGFGRHGSGGMMFGLYDDLDLTDNQKTEIKELIGDYFLEYDLSDMSKRQLKKMRKAFKSDLEDVLTDDQIQMLDDYDFDNSGYGFHHSGKGMWGSGGYGMFGIDLTDDQKYQMKEVMVKYFLDYDFSEMTFAERWSARQTMRDEMKSILTEEQLSEIEEWRADCPGFGDLDLTAEQIERIEAVIETNKAQMKEELKDILTEEQLEKIEEFPFFGKKGFLFDE